MTSYNLTQRQKDLLKKIVSGLEAGKVKQPINPVYTDQENYILGIDQPLGPDLRGDLEALSDTDLMGSRQTNSGKVVYTVKKMGFDAIRHDFALPEAPTDTPTVVGAIINEMKGGNVQAIGRAEHARVQQIVNDPKLLREEVDRLTAQLIDSVSPDLPANDLAAYKRTLEELKKEIISDDPSQSRMRHLFGSLAFLGDLGTISLISRVWPLIYPLVMIAAEAL